MEGRAHKVEEVVRNEVDEQGPDSDEEECRQCSEREKNIGGPKLSFYSQYGVCFQRQR